MGQSSTPWSRVRSVGSGVVGTAPPFTAPISRVAAYLTTLLGIAVLAGWAADVDSLKSVIAGTVSMKPNTAVGFVISGLALLLLSEPGASSSRRRGGWALAAIGALAGGATLLEYLLDVSLGMDTLLFAEDPTAPATSRPGRMAPTTALSFLLCGLALVLLDRSSGARLPPSDLLIAPVAVIALWAVTGYLYGADYPSGLPTYTRMAIHTAVGFLTLVAGISGARRHGGFAALLMSPAAGGVLARRLLPAGIGLPLLVGGLRVYGEQTGLYGLEFGSALFAALLAALLASAILWTASALDRTDAERRRAEEEVGRLNADLERRIQERTSELEAANSGLESFAYSVSHDLRAPLRAMDGFSRILLEKHAASLEDEGRRYLGIIRENAVRMGELIDALLTLSRHSRKTLDRRNVDVRALIDEALEGLAAERADREVEISVGEIPPCQADPALLRQVVVNLLANALKFTRNREHARIEIGSTSNGTDETVYFVRDNGVGFDPRYTEKLFGVFQRLHRAEEFEGHGVGLATVQRIVTRHGGRVWAEGEPGRGATFYFTQKKGGST